MYDHPLEIYCRVNQLRSKRKLSPGEWIYINTEILNRMRAKTPKLDL